MSIKVVLPAPPEKYDPRAEAQRNVLIEQGFSRTGGSGTGGSSAGTLGIFDGGFAGSTYSGPAVIDGGSST